MRRRSRTWSLCVYVLAVVLLVAASSGAAVAASKTVVRVTSWWASEGFLNELKAAFEAKNPDIEIQYQTIASGYYTVLPTMIAGGSSPDIAMLGFSSIASYAKKTSTASCGAAIR